MADVTFTLGADDRQVQAALDRIDRGTKKAGSSFERAFRFAVVGQASTRAFSLASNAMREAAGSSDIAAERLDRITRTIDKFESRIGNDLLAAFEGVEVVIDGIGNSLEDITDWIADRFNGGESSRIRELEREAEAIAKATASYKRMQEQLMEMDATDLKLQGKPYEADLKELELRFERDMKRFGEDPRLTEENRRQLQDRRRSLYETEKADALTREQERLRKLDKQTNRVSFLGPGDISSAAGVRQILGAGSTTNSSPATVTASSTQKTAQNTSKMVQTAEQQKKLLEDISRGVRGGARFQ